jgi:ferrous iron transport protein B
LSTLIDLREGTTGTILKVRGRGAFRKRITEMGFIRGKEVTLIKAAPLQDPLEYKIMGYNVSLRKSEAALVEILTDEEERYRKGVIHDLGTFNGTIEDQLLENIPSVKGNLIDIALVGNPNCGKTTLFNFASGSHEHVGNFGGVTVDSKTARFRQDGYAFNITDLPGTYSLSAYSPEELYVRNHIFRTLPDVVVNIVDASNLERNLFLTTQLIDMDIRVVIALNMYDELEGRGDRLDHKSLGKLLGIPVVPMVSSKGIGVKELFEKIIDVYEGRDAVSRHIHINYGMEIERSLKRIQDAIWKDKALTLTVASRYYAVKLLEKDAEVRKSLSQSVQYSLIIGIADQETARLEAIYHEDSGTLVSDAKYGFIAGALRETFTENLESRRVRSLSDRIDSVLTNRVLGFPVFILFLWVMFQTTFSLGSYPQKWIELGVAQLHGWTGQILSSGPLKDLLLDGVINGVGSVIVFLPNILILFFFISLMEDTGYMARAAFIMDKLMHKMGLHGQSFIPLIMGFGCNVPAIMVTRTLRNRNDRLATMLINPFMSCSARLPVYILIAGAVFPNHAGTAIFLLYLTGIVLAVLISLIFKKTLFKSKEAPFVMELPPYRMPTLKVSLRHMWDKGQQYLKKMGGVILLAVILIWALEYFPAGPSATPDERLERSYIASVGKFVQPVIAPLGFDWRMGVSLMTGAAAKEVVVSTMGVLYGTSHNDHPATQNLTATLAGQTRTSGPGAGGKLFTPLVGASYLLFILIYMPCVAVIATVSKESGSWKWALFLMVYTTVLAWLFSFAVFQIGTLMGF